MIKINNNKDKWIKTKETLSGKQYVNRWLVLTIVDKERKLRKNTVLLIDDDVDVCCCCHTLIQSWQLTRLDRLRSSLATTER